MAHRQASIVHGSGARDGAERRGLIGGRHVRLGRIRARSRGKVIVRLMDHGVCHVRLGRIRARSRVSGKARSAAKLGQGQSRVMESFRGQGWGQRRGQDHGVSASEAERTAKQEPAAEAARLAAAGVEGGGAGGGGAGGGAGWGAGGCGGAPAGRRSTRCGRTADQPDRRRRLRA